MWRRRQSNFKHSETPRSLLKLWRVSLTMEPQPKHASALQKQLTPQMWGQARQGQEAAVLRLSSEKVGLDFSPITHHVAMAATPPEDFDHHQTDTAHGQTDVSSGHFQASSLPNQFYIRSLLTTGELLPVRRWRRRPVDALSHRMRHVDDVSIMVSDCPDFGERKTRGEVRRVEVSNRQQTTYSGHHENAPVGRGGGDRAVVVH